MIMKIFSPRWCYVYVGCLFAWKAVLIVYWGWVNECVCVYDKRGFLPLTCTTLLVFENWLLSVSVSKGFFVPLKTWQFQGQPWITGFLKTPVSVLASLPTSTPQLYIPRKVLSYLDSGSCKTGKRWHLVIHSIIRLWSPLETHGMVFPNLQWRRKNLKTQLCILGFCRDRAKWRMSRGVERN